ncbi:MAG: two-component regulator propeller domain-containing protein [Bacteroidota bacterium]
MKIYFSITFFLLTLISCKKDSELSNESNNNGLHMVTYQLFEPPGWTCVIDSSSKFYCSNAIAIDTNEVLWIGGNYRFGKYENNIFTKYPEVTNMLNFYMDISSIVKDKSNNLWIGSNYTDVVGGDSYTRRGVIKFDGQNFTQYDEYNSDIHNGIIFSIAIDDSNNKWIGTNNSIVKFDGTTWSFFDSMNSPLKEFYPIKTLGNIVTIGGHNALVLFDDAVWQVLNQSNSSFPSSGVRIMEHDNFGNLWFVGYHSTVLWKFDGVNFTSFSIPIISPLNPNFGLYANGEEYFSIKIDNQNNIWLGGYGKLVKFDGTIWTNFSAPSYIPGGDPRLPTVGVLQYSIIRDMVIKSDSSIWVASSGFALMKFKE